MHFDLTELIKTIGLLGVYAIVFAESGLLIGFFLPGDSLLFTAGFLASQNFLPFLPLLIGTTIAAIVGDSFGYAFGHKMGKKLFKHEDSLIFHKDHLLKAEAYYEKHGGKTIIFARFIPIIRTFAPFVAGVSYMNIRLFSYYNVVSAILWIGTLLGAGYYFGSIPMIKNNFTLVIYAIIAISLLPPTIALLHKTFAKVA